VTDLSDFGGGLDQSALAADRRDDEQQSLGVQCDVEGCTTDVVGLDDGWEFSRGVTCSDCIDFRHRHAHWPDESPETCAECLIDDGQVRHHCDEGIDQIRDPGVECDECGTIIGLTVTEDDGLWLPTDHVEAARVIIRTPTATIDWRESGDEANRRWHPSVTPLDWDEDYLSGEGRTAKIRNEECLPESHDGVPRVGLMIAGTGDQEWYPVEIEDGDQA